MPLVESSAIARIHFEPAERTLDIWYRGGGQYRYLDVPLPLYAQLMAAASKGSFVNQRIKPHFECVEIGARKRFRPHDD